MKYKYQNIIFLAAYLLIFIQAALFFLSSTLVSSSLKWLLLILYILSIYLIFYCYCLKRDLNYLSTLKVVIFIPAISAISITINAFSFYRGLAKDIDIGFCSLVIYFLKMFLVDLGITFILFNVFWYSYKLYRKHKIR